MQRTEAISTMKYYVRLKKELEDDFERFEQKVIDLFREGEMMAMNPSDSEIRKHKEMVHRIVFEEYKDKKDQQHELLGEIEERMQELIDKIDYGLDIESFMHKYGLE